jgi:hypothetical protein
MPSLDPDSAERRFRKCPGTRLANLPLPTTDDARTGSVAVIHAPTQRDSTYTITVIGQKERYKVESWYQPVYEGAAHDPAEGHDRDKQQKKTARMSPHVSLG